MGAIVEHCRDVAADAAEGVLADNCENNARGADILLGSAVDQVIFGNIHRAAHDIRRHISD